MSDHRHPIEYWKDGKKTIHLICTFCKKSQWAYLINTGPETASFRCEYCDRISVFKLSDNRIIKSLLRTVYMKDYKDRLIDQIKD